MKIRILGNSLRLRLSQTEVNNIISLGWVEQSISFAAQGAVQLRYRLEASEENVIKAKFIKNCICVSVPKAQIQNWASSTMISLPAEQKLDENSTLSILIEKDFKCLDPNRKENESDLFPNPKESHPNC